MLFKLKVLDAPAVLFRVFYFVTKANGLLPITLSFNPLNARSSFLNVFYSVCYTLMLLVCLPCSQAYVIAFIGILQNPKETIIIVFLAQVTCSGIRVATIYVAQLFNYKHLANFINRSIKINDMFMKNRKRQKHFIDLKLSKWCLSKLISTILQVVLMLVPSIGFIAIIRSSDNFLLLLLCFLTILYSHMVLILSTGIYFSGMIVVGQFYRNLNSRILILEKEFIPSKRTSNSFYMGMQHFCNLSDELDKLTCLYREITNHAKLFNKNHRCFLMFSLIEYFVIILAEIFDLYTRIMRNVNVNSVSHKNSTFTQLLKEFGFIFFYVIELYYTISVTSFVQNEAKKTSAMLKLCNRPHYDIRFRRSIETISLHTLLHEPIMSVCGLFKVDNCLLFGMAATFASYLLILVQFELDDN